jgi:catechol 2,3-dioxygenase
MQADLETKTEFRIPPATRPGLIHLTVANLDRQLTFYQHALGLTLHWREDDSAGLGVGGKDLLRLTQVTGARRHPHTSGLYHFALLLPNRRELALAIARLFQLRYPNSPTDHVMTKTTYLDDLEGNNIELYTETPEDGTMGFKDGQFSAQHADGTPSDGREPVDLEALFSLLTSDDRLDQPLPPGTVLGHYHLFVADIQKSFHFYHDVLGFDNMGLAAQMGMGMVSAGNYHHHIGFNTWQGKGVPPQPPDSLGMRYLTFVLPTPNDLETLLTQVQNAGIDISQHPEGWLVRDPDEINFVFTAKGS